MNDNDAKLIEFCRGRSKTIREIADHLGISVKNVIVRLPLLEKQKLIKIRKDIIKKKKVISTLDNPTIIKEMVAILKELELKKEIPFKDFIALNQINPLDDEKTFFIKERAFSRVQFSNLITKKVSLSEEGLKFLKENEK